ncbi:MAG: fused MFS/spermidine synthase [Pseudohongiellaceae bacterium]|nr:fused MFS/spermidine synthase [Pseudohongiellaceae bacterium]
MENLRITNPKPFKLLQSLAALFLFVSVSLLVEAETIHEERSLYRNIFVNETGDRRCLMFDAPRGERNQTCINTRDEKEMLFHYTRMSMAGLLLNPDPKNILIVGLGGGTVPKALNELYPEAQIDVLEIDQAVVNVARDYFNFVESDKMRVDVVDGRVFIKRAGIQGKKYDFIMLDAFTGEYIPEHMLTQEFLEEVKAIMTPDAVLVANTFTTSNLYAHESETYKAVFGEFFNFKLPGTGNRVIIATLQELPASSALKRVSDSLADNLKPYGVDIQQFPMSLTTRSDWDTSKRVLTDQFSPANLLN